MPKTYEGGQDAAGLRFAIVASRYNERVTRELLDGALTALSDRGVYEGDVDVAWCPGAFEVPLVALHMARSGRYAAVVTVGAVIRGETSHYDFVAGGVADGLLRAGLETGVPILFGVLTVETLEQAFERAGGRHGNRGADAAAAAVEMARLLESLPSPP